MVSHRVPWPPQRRWCDFAQDSDLQRSEGSSGVKVASTRPRFGGDDLHAPGEEADGAAELVDVGMRRSGADEGTFRRCTGANRARDGRLLTFVR